MIHDLDSFRHFLNKRIEDKSALFKQKNDIHSEIKKIEQEKVEAIAYFNVNVDKEEQKNLKKQINELHEKLLNATRTEARIYHVNITNLKRKKASFEDEVLRFDDQIIKKQNKIDKIVEQY